MACRGRPLPAVRRDRERQDGDVPARVRGGRRPRPGRDRARPRDRADTADGRPLPRALRRERGRAPLGDDPTPSGETSASGSRRARRASSSARGPRSSLPCAASASSVSTRSTTRRTSRSPIHGTTLAPWRRSGRRWKGRWRSTGALRRGPRAGRSSSGSSSAPGSEMGLPGVLIVDMRRESGYPLSGQLAGCARRRGRAPRARDRPPQPPRCRAGRPLPLVRHDDPVRELRRRARSSQGRRRCAVTIAAALARHRSIATSAARRS